MPLFKRRDNPGLDGLTSDEKRKNQAHAREVARIYADSPGGDLEYVNMQVLARKAQDQPEEFLWAYLVGWQLLRMGRFEDALKWLEKAKGKRPGDCRGPYAVATTYYTAATHARGPCGQWPGGEACLGMSVTELYAAALEQFSEAFRLAETGRDRRLISSTAGAILATAAAYGSRQAGQS